MQQPAEWQLARLLQLHLRMSRLSALETEQAPAAAAAVELPLAAAKGYEPAPAAQVAVEPTAAAGAAMEEPLSAWSVAAAAVQGDLEHMLAAAVLIQLVAAGQKVQLFLELAGATGLPSIGEARRLINSKCDLHLGMYAVCGEAPA